jgi:DHA1 family bicyclomycin/chloramphenicol resistance-like MFS transporter
VSARGLGVLLTAVVGIGALSIDMLLPSLPTMVRHFRSDAPTVQLTVTLFLVGFAVAQLVFGPLSDRHGRRRALLGGLGLYAVGALGCALAPSAPVLVLARVIQGLGAGSGPAVGRAIVRDVHAPEEGARMLALMATAQALTPILAPILGGYLQLWSGWRGVFVAQGVMGLAFLAAAGALLRETAPAHDLRALRPRALVRDAVALLSDPRYVGFALVVALVFSGQFAFISGSAFVLIGMLQVSPEVYGYCFGAVSVGLMAGSFLTARHTRRHGTRRLIAIGAAVSAAAGTVLFALPLAGSVTVAGIVAPMSVYALGVGLVMPSGMAAAIGPFPHAAGLASALLGFLQMSGSALYGIAVSQLYDGTARPMTGAIALSGVACAGCYVGLLRVRRA